MATLPAANYLSNAARTEAEMQTALDALRDVVAEIGSTAPTTRTISSGAMPVPTSSMALVQSEGHSGGSPDVLVTITTTGIDQGRIVILRNANTASTTSAASERISISHGTSAGQIELADNASFILCAERLIALVYSGNHWVELWRNYGRRNAEDSIYERNYLGLGTASVETIATANGASANSKVLKVAAGANIGNNDILAMDASGNIKAGTATGGNADTLDNYDSTAFVRKADTSTHSLNASVQSTTAGSTRLNANTTQPAQNPGFGMLHNGSARGLIYTNPSSGIMNIVTKDSGNTDTPMIRLNPANDRLEFSSGAGFAFQSLRPGPGNGLDADTLDGSQLSEILSLVATNANGAGTGGSIRLGDGTTDLLVQWPGTWVSSGAGAAKRLRWTFSAAYSSAPIVIGATIRAQLDDGSGLIKQLFIHDYTSTTTYIEHNGSFTSGDTYQYSRVGSPIVIGAPA
tara:strand:+ start:5692 stop:7080 length:1389 start_codon:yes stop_codon:yes gene_type:complete